MPELSSPADGNGAQVRPYAYNCTCRMVVGQPLPHDCPDCLAYKAKGDDRIQRMKEAKADKAAYRRDIKRGRKASKKP